MGDETSAEKPDPESEEPAPRGRSFVIGCGIGLIGVILVFGVLLAIGRRAEARRQAATRTLLKTVGDAIVAHHARTGRYPSAAGTGADFSGQLALEAAGVTLPEAHKERGLVVDAWGGSLVYRCTTPARFALYSCGPNGRDDSGTFDDLRYAGE